MQGDDIFYRHVYNSENENKQTGAEDRMNQNEKKEMKIRIAKEEDAEALLAIYAPYIEYTVITYEYDVPTVEEFRGKNQTRAGEISISCGRVKWGNMRICICKCLSRQTGRWMECRDIYLCGPK